MTGSGGFGGGGGGGGAGGYGAIVTGPSASSNTSTVSGGRGGAGGVSGDGTSGNGGDGGIGIYFTTPGATLANSGSISGGAGGAGGAAGPSVGLGAGSAGAGGAGIVGADLTIINSGAIAGGLSGGATPVRADAITFTGGANTLTLQDGFSLTGNIGVTGSVNFNQVTDQTLGNAITGTGSVVKTGAGTLTLSGASTYSGNTTVNAGTLSVIGSIASSSLVSVNAGATLGGTGFVGNTLINGGSLAPGNSVGTLNVTGNLAFTSTSRYMVDVTPADADRVNVSGTATLGGATVNASFAAGSYVNKHYTIVNATGGVTGTFGSQVNTNLPSNFTSALSYDANNAYLDLTLNLAPEASAPLNGNQQQVANAIASSFNTNGSIPLIFGSLGPLGLQQLSGQLRTGIQAMSFSFSNMAMKIQSVFAPIPTPYGALGYADEALTDRSQRRPSDALAAIYRKAPPRAPVFVERWNVWASGFGGSQTTDGNATIGSSRSNSLIFGAAVGADYLLSPATTAGFMLAGGGTNFGTDGGGSGHSDVFQVGVSMRHSMASSYIAAAMAYGWQDVTTERSIGTGLLQGRFQTNSWSGRIEAGNRFAAPWFGGVGLTPYAAARVTALVLPAYAESGFGGSSIFALNTAGQTVTAPRSELGLRTDKSIALDDAILTLRGRAAWAHDFNTERSVQTTFQALPGASFVINGTPAASDAALTTAEAELRFVSGISVGATFEGEFSDVTRSYAGKGVVRYAW
ncbi:MULTISPECIES: autotransporter domain-containing protein [Rhodopseudomonas]|uniref:autotransporter family protein n=1 Tax=Rhodopseudomonas TaxID=1073 RepID=UPI001F30D1BE|nr:MULTISPECIES: autotransporter domain-containing protein [Rhodopseudomonas]MDF3813070.1 autotransporter domain-containing protein [Rhodopseudomonas sp. BAL398]WOK19250.1 autotransporter domain-containing protein [Rhodopseudomonas sp. BAL398]